MPDATDLIAQHFSIVSGQVAFGKQILIDAIVKNVGTPMFVYDSCVIDKKVELLRATLPQEFSISYSVKANPCQAILRHLLSKGCGLEIASGGEFFQARQAGCAPEDIVFAGPGKTEDELEQVLKEGIGEIHAESLLEVERIATIGERLGLRARVAIRVNPTGDALGGAMRMGGQATPFGIDEEELDSVMNHVRQNPWLEFSGLHLFSGTQILDFGVLLSQYRKGIEIARYIVKQTNVPLHTIDFGGGLGIPYFGKESELEMEPLARGLQELLSGIRGDPAFSGTRLMVEPGRYLVGESGVYVTQVTDIKISRKKKFVIVDGGMHQHLAASGNFGQVIKKNFPVCVLNKIDKPLEERVDVVGPLCTPLDVLARGVELPKIAVGDWIGVLQSGAYARTASPVQFLSHCAPPEVFVNGEQAEVVRRRGTYDDMVREFC